jgi:uncharacterized protein (DUF1810 family)
MHRRAVDLMAADSFDLGRFVQAQDQVMEQVRVELRAGRKRSHWMWFVFPQLRGLGHSTIARHYAIASLAEADAFVKHLVLGSRLIECTQLVCKILAPSINQIFGAPDDLKFHSCMTLFSLLPNAAPVFRLALDQYFAGALDRLTTEKLAALSGSTT